MSVRILHSAITWIAYFFETVTVNSIAISFWFIPLTDQIVFLMKIFELVE